MKHYLLGLIAFGIISCMNSSSSQISNANTLQEPEVGLVKHFKGALTGGFKGDSIFFDVSANGKKVENIIFKGYWRCSGKLEMIRGVGPDGAFDIKNGEAKGKVSDPPNGGSTAWHFDFAAAIKGKEASGTFRMNINNLGCDSYLLKFIAVAK
jgi:hypothetical protein